MAEPFPTFAGGATQGLLQGAQVGSQIAQGIRQDRMLKQQQEQQVAQQGEQARQEKWERGYKTAALAVQTAGIQGLPDEMKARILNNGFLPLWNDPDFDVGGNNKMAFEPFTAESLQDKELQKVIGESKRLAGDKELSQNPELQMQAITGLWMDYHGKRGSKAEAQKLALDLVRPKESKDTADKSFTQANQLRDQFASQTKDFRIIRDAYQRVTDSSSDPSAAGDLALIFNYMKILDPGSVVREGEFATAQNAASVPERLRAQYNKVIAGERLSDATRHDFVNRAGRLFEGQGKIYQKNLGEFRRIAKEANLSESIFPEAFIPSGPAPQSNGSPVKGKKMTPEEEAAAYLGGG